MKYNKNKTKLAKMLCLRNMTQKELSERLNVGQTSVSSMAINGVQTARKAVVIAKILKCSPLQIIELD